MCAAQPLTSAPAPATPAVRLYIGGDARTVQRRPCMLTGEREFSAAHRCNSRFPAALVPQVRGLLDSGAFSDAPEKRLSPGAALGRQLAWEGSAERFWGVPWRCEALVGYDLLIDEKWAGGTRHKERWSVREADRAVRVTVEAAAYLASQRERLAPRTLVLPVQGVDAMQYGDCLQGVLAHATAHDWIGLGGWCIVGKWRSWLPVYWATLRRCLPHVAAAGVRHVHIFGVLWRPALGGLLWLADRCGLTVSTDSSSPMLGPTWPDRQKAGNVLAPTWEENCRLWTEALATLRDSPHYREPPPGRAHRQLTLF